MKLSTIIVTIIISSVFPLNLHAQSAPQFLNLKDRTAVIGRPADFKVAACDNDTAEENLVYSAAGLPHGAAFDPAARIFSWTPGPEDAGTYKVTFTVSDGIYSTDSFIIIRTMSVDERRLTTGARASGRPAIYNDRIVWSDHRNGNYDIYMYDLGTQMEAPIEIDAALQINPAIYDGKVVWEGLSAPEATKHDIYLYDIASGSKIRITDSSADFGSPAIYGDYVAYSRMEPSSDYSLYLYNIATAQTVKISNENIPSSGFSIFKDKIAWSGRRVSPPSYWTSGFDSNIYIYDIVSAQTTMVNDSSAGSKPMPFGRTRLRTASAGFSAANLHQILEDIRSGIRAFAIRGSSTHPQLTMFGDTLFWQTCVWNGVMPFFKIFSYDILTGNSHELPDGINGAGFAIYGDKVVCPEWAEDYGVWLYNISTGEKIKLTTSSASANLAIYEDKVVWVSSSGEIYMAAIVFAPRAISASIAVVSGGYLVNIKGTGFGYEQESSYVEYENGAHPAVTEWDDTCISLMIPESDVNGVIPEIGVVRVFTPAGVSNSLEISLPVIMNAPTNLTVSTVNPAKVDLRWKDNSGNENGFTIEVSSDGGSTYSQAGLAGIDTEAFTVGNLASNRTYYFRIYAFSLVGNSRYSNVVSATTPPLSKPVVNAFASPTSENPYLFSGTKDAFTSLYMNGSEAVPLNSDTAWSAAYTLSHGNNSIVVSAKDSAGNQSEAEAIAIVFDTTPPVVATVTDDGTATHYPDRLHASWTAVDDETMITGYSYAIGTSAGGTDIAGWTPCGTDTDITVSGLDLNNEAVYYFSVMAVNAVGLWSQPAVSDGIIVSQTAPVIVSVQPLSGTVAEAEGDIAFTINASDAEADAILYKIDIDGMVLRDWLDAPLFNWDTSSEAPGIKHAVLYAKDAWGNESSVSVDIYLVRRALDTPQVTT